MSVSLVLKLLWSGFEKCRERDRGTRLRANGGSTSHPAGIERIRIGGGVAPSILLILSPGVRIHRHGTQFVDPGQCRRSQAAMPRRGGKRGHGDEVCNSCRCRVRQFALGPILPAMPKPLVTAADARTRRVMRSYGAGGTRVQLPSPLVTVEGSDAKPIRNPHLARLSSAPEIPWIPPGAHRRLIPVHFFPDGSAIVLPSTTNRPLPW